MFFNHIGEFPLSRRWQANSKQGEPQHRDGHQGEESEQTEAKFPKNKGWLCRRERLWKNDLDQPPPWPPCSNWGQTECSQAPEGRCTLEVKIFFLTQVSHFTQHFVDQLDLEVSRWKCTKLAVVSRSVVKLVPWSMFSFVDTLSFNLKLKGFHKVCPVELVQRHLPGLRHEEYRKMLGQFGVIFTYF